MYRRIFGRATVFQLFLWRGARRGRGRGHAGVAFLFLFLVRVEY